MTRKSNIAAALTLLPLVVLLLVFSFRSEKVPDHIDGTVQVNRVLAADGEIGSVANLIIPCDQYQSVCKDLYQLKINQDNAKNRDSQSGNYSNYCDQYSITSEGSSEYFYLNTNSCLDDSADNPVKEVNDILKNFDEGQWKKEPELKNSYKVEQ